MRPAAAGQPMASIGSGRHSRLAEPGAKADRPKEQILTTKMPRQGADGYPMESGGWLLSRGLIPSDHQLADRGATFQQGLPAGPVVIAESISPRRSPYHPGRVSLAPGTKRSAGSLAGPGLLAKGRTWSRKSRWPWMARPSPADRGRTGRTKERFAG